MELEIGTAQPGAAGSNILSGNYPSRVEVSSRGVANRVGFLCANCRILWRNCSESSQRGTGMAHRHLLDGGNAYDISSPGILAALAPRNTAPASGGDYVSRSKCNLGII